MTRYALLDIDSGSRYHPRNNSQGIDHVLRALEPLGLVSYVACTSSYSGGLHLYFPFDIPQNSQRLAHAIKGRLQQTGIALMAGQLELFPNPRPYSNISAKTAAQFNGHRLPLQPGSYLLNDDFHPIWTSQERFTSHWGHCSAQNDVTAAGIRRALNQQRRQYVVSGKANKFLNDLNAEIEPGWTGPSQTNHLLGRIALRCYVFSHILSGGPPLSGRTLTDAIVAIATALPGYTDWCQHQQEIYQRAEDWARCVEASKYYPYGLGKRPAEKPVETAEAKRNWNQEQFLKTADKIKAAMADLGQIGLPDTATARFKALLTYGIGGGSLYRHKNLWHPDCVVTPVECCDSKRNGEDIYDPKPEAGLESSTGLPTALDSTPSFLPSTGGNLPDSKASSAAVQHLTGGNFGFAWEFAFALTLIWFFHQLPYRIQFLAMWRSLQRTSTG